MAKEEKTLKHLHNKLKNQNAMVTRAEKGIKMVVTHERDYMEKSENQITKVKSDPTKRFQRGTQKLIITIKSILLKPKSKEHKITPECLVVYQRFQYPDETYERFSELHWHIISPHTILQSNY